MTLRTKDYFQNLTEYEDDQFDDDVVVVVAVVVDVVVVAAAPWPIQSVLLHKYNEQNHYVILVPN
jgi:hypothetical protein